MATDPTDNTTPAAQYAEGAARLPLVRPRDASPELTAIYERIAGVRGGVGNPFRVLGSNPEALDALSTFGAYVRSGTHLELATLEAVILTVTQAIGCQYMWTHHWRVLRSTGLSDAEIVAALDTEGPGDRAVAVRTAKAVAVGDELDAAQVDELRAALGDAAAIDVLLTAYYYMLHGRLIRDLAVPLEPGVDPVAFVEPPQPAVSGRP